MESRVLYSSCPDRSIRSNGRTCFDGNRSGEREAAPAGISSEFEETMAKGTFENGNFGALTRRMLADKVVSAIPHGRGDPKPPRKPKTPRVQPSS